MDLILSKYSVNFIKEKEYHRNIFEFIINNKLFFKNIIINFVYNQKLNFNYISQINRTDTKIYNKILTKRKNIFILYTQNNYKEYSFYSVKTIFSNNSRYDLKSSLLVQEIYKISPIYNFNFNQNIYYVNSLNSYKLANILAYSINSNNINQYIISISSTFYSYNRPNYINYFIERTAKSEATINVIYKNSDIYFYRNYNFYNYIETVDKLFYNDFNITEVYNSLNSSESIKNKIENSTYNYINKVEINYDALKIYHTANIVLEDLIKFKGFDSTGIYENCDIKITSVSELIQYLNDITSADFTSTEILLEFVNYVFYQYLDGTYVLDFTTVNEILKYVEFKPIDLKYEVPQHTNFINLDFRTLGDVLIIDTTSHYREIIPGVYNIFILTDTNVYVEIKDKNDLKLKFNIKFEKSPLKYSYIN